MTVLLNRAQAEAVHAAMVALNNVSGRIHVRLEREAHTCLQVAEYDDGRVTVHIWNAATGCLAKLPECYADQNAFAKAYGLAD